MKNCQQHKSIPLRSLHNVGVCFKRREGMFKFSSCWALVDVSFDLYPGEVLGLIGRNGAGKTTLLQLIAGIIEPDRGELQSNGGQATLLSLQLGFVGHLSGRQNAIMSGLLLGLRRNEIEARLEEVKDFAQLGDYFEFPIRHYSAGMRARLGFSVALQMNPDIFLIDEVLGVGDAEFRKKSAAAMRDKIRSDRTIVIVSHEISMIQQLCDRVVWIEDGKTRAQGKPEEIAKDYKNYLTAHTQQNSFRRN